MTTGVNEPVNDVFALAHCTHDSGAGTERVGGHVGRELGLDDTRVSVRPRDTSPHYADLGTGNLPLGLVDVSDTL